MPFQASLPEIQSWISTYGLWVVFLSLALENVLFISMIVPGLFVLIAAGFIAASGDLSFGWVLVMGIAGVWLGDTANYFIGRHLWGRLFGRSDRASAALYRAGLVLEQRGSLVFTIYHFEPIVRMIGAAAFGTARVPIRRWLPFDYLGAVLWVSFYGTVGHILGRLSRDIDDWNSVQPVQVIALLIVLAWVVFVARTMRRMIAQPERSIES